MNPRIYSLFVFLLIFHIGVNAQTEDDHVGCHHAHAKRAPLTAEAEAKMFAEAERSDTIDVIDYAITLDVTDFSGRIIDGDCIVSFASKMDNIDHINLDLQNLTVDSVLMGDMNLTYEYDGLLLTVNLPTVLNTGDEAAVQVFYNGTPDTDPSDFGGFAFQNGYAYNLGIGLTSNPPNFGRSWFPCFDNFVERTTYEFNITSRSPNRAYCVGSFIEEVELPDNLIRRTYQMSQPIPTYLSSVAISNYVESNGMHEGVAGMLPTQLIAQPNDIDNMTSTFSQLGDAIDALEFWYGPYDWERVGYVATPVGAMEHPTNIAYPISSATGGNTFGHRRLMAHELAHCWWGDIVTVGSARDMWVKEGNAEYGAHLMTEFTFGHEAFIDQVKDNHLSEVLIAAHIDDGDFLPLSNIPFEHIYGTHTYRKGAAMLHNMRGYLGDELFKQGQRAVLEKYRYASASAQQYRDALTEATGYDMTSFFNDWILNPGYSAFETTHTYASNGNEYNVNLDISQKVRAAPSLHTDVPIEITCIDANGNKDMQQIIASGEMTNVDITSSVEPVWITVNENNKLNMAHMSYQTNLEEVASVNLPYVEMALNITNLPQPTFLHVDHYWVAPDPIENTDEAVISSTHYWRVIGDLDNGIQTGASIEYTTILDKDLTENGEENVILVYRKNKNEAWGEYPFYNKLILSPTDGNGFIRLQEVMEGEYAFASGELPLYTSLKQLDIVETPLNIYPNPASAEIQIEQTYKNPISTIQMEVINVEGKLLHTEEMNLNSTDLKYQLSVEDFPVGTYWVKLTDQNGFILAGEMLEVIR